MLAAALSYAARGWAVFPVWAPTPEGGCTCGDPECLDQGKHPVSHLAPHGFKDATTDPAIIRRWWKRMPSANIGVAAGASGLCIIDIDTHNGVDGFATWEQLKAQHPGLSDETVTAVTGGGGWHLFYAGAGGQKFRAELGPGVDVKSNGGYIVAPPSKHKSGGAYVFDPQRDPTQMAPAPIPPVLEQLLTKPAPPPPPPPAVVATTGGTIIKRTAGSHVDDLRKAEAALGCLAAWRADDYLPAGAWLEVGMALRELEDRGLALWEAWSRQSAKYEPGVCAVKWETFTPGGDGKGRGLGSLIEWAKQDNPAGWERFLETQRLTTSTTSSTTAQTGAEEPPAERKPRYVLHRAVEAWEPRPPKEWLLEGLVGAGDLVLLVGAPGVGKTYWFLDLAVQVATGREFLELATSSSGVLVVDEESGNRRLLDRLERIMRGRGLPPGTDIPLHYTTMAGFSFLVDPMWFVDLRMAIEETGARLVVLDALADIMLGGDENAVKDTQPIFRGLKGVCEVTGATILVVHHANRAGTYRGSSAIPGAVDLVLQLSRKDKTGPVTVETAKERDIEPTKFACRMVWDEVTDSVKYDRATEPAEDAEGASAGPADPGYGRGERFVLKYLLGHPNGPTRREIVDAADICASGTARNALYNLSDTGYVQRLDRDGAGDRTRWGLTAAGRAAAADLS